MKVLILIFMFVITVYAVGAIAENAKTNATIFEKTAAKGSNISIVLVTVVYDIAGLVLLFKGV